MTVTIDRTDSAAQHLVLLRNENNPAQDRLYVRLAAQHGMTPADIAKWSELPVERVRDILAGE